jgi:hypothetical protein
MAASVHDRKHGSLKTAGLVGSRHCMCGKYSLFVEEVITYLFDMALKLTG